MRLKLLDLFCGAGGAGLGYHLAGFEVTGVDSIFQPRYPFEFIQSDAISYLRKHHEKYFAIHASPPCQRYSVASKGHTGCPENHPDLVGVLREELKATRVQWVIENVVGAPLILPITLCGTMFSKLRVIRHRLFESNNLLEQPRHGTHPLCYTHDKRKPHYGMLNEAEAFVQVTGGGNCSVQAARSAMGISWMTKRELNQAIPPAYTEYVGGQLLDN